MGSRSILNAALLLCASAGYISAGDLRKEPPHRTNPVDAACRPTPLPPRPAFSTQSEGKKRLAEWQEAARKIGDQDGARCREAREAANREKAEQQAELRRQSELQNQQHQRDDARHAEDVKRWEEQQKRDAEAKQAAAKHAAECRPKNHQWRLAHPHYTKTINPLKQFNDVMLPLGARAQLKEKPVTYVVIPDSNYAATPRPCLDVPEDPADLTEAAFDQTHPK